MKRAGSFSSSLDLPRVPNVELEPLERPPFTGQEPPRVQNVELEQPGVHNVEFQRRI